MAWEKVAQAQVSSSGVQGDVWKTLDELTVGTKGLLSLQGPGIGPIMDAGGVEAIVQGVFWTKGVDIKVLDCYGEGLDNGYIKFTGSPAAVVAVLVALGPVLTALFYLGIVVVAGLFIWKALSIAEKLIENPLALLFIGGIVYLLVRRNRDKKAQVQVPV